MLLLITLQLSWFGLTSSSEKPKIMKLESHNVFQMLGKNIYFYKFAGLLGASAVILGAYGAHGKLTFLL